MITARCPHCGRPDAPVINSYFDRHRRAGWDRLTSPGNELCLITMHSYLKPGDTCTHPDGHPGHVDSAGEDT